MTSVVIQLHCQLQRMFEAIPKAKLGDDVYDEDVEVLELQQYAAELLGKEASLFFPSGTQSNLTAILFPLPTGR